MEVSGVEVIGIFMVWGIGGMGSVVDEFERDGGLIGCRLVGGILGDMRRGIIMGGSLEMIGVGWMNMGGGMGGEGGVGCVICRIVVIGGDESMGGGIGIGMGVGGGGEVLSIMWGRIRVFLEDKGDGFGEEGNLRGIDMWDLGGLLVEGLGVGVGCLVVGM